MTTKAETRNTLITLGDLVVAITDRARRVAASEGDAYRIARFILSRMLRPIPELATGRSARFGMRKNITLDFKYL